MAEVNNCPEPTLPAKRIPDLTAHDSPTEPKKQKLETPENNDCHDNGNQTLENAVVSDELETPEPTKQEEVKQQLEEEDEEEEEEERINGKAEIDRKGKGILIEEDDEDDEDEDDDDDDDSGSDSDSDTPIGDELSDDSDFVDDPLAEVDLDNILPSRTRRKSINPGVYLKDIPEEGEDSDESDDPDA